MKRTWIVFALIAAAAVWGLAVASPAHASNEIAAATGLVCTSCHDKPGSKLLTDRGKYYELMGSLDGFDEIGEAYGACTTCHVRKPGSKRLTPEGKRLARAIEDMDALRRLVLSEHPAPPAAKGPGDGSASAAPTTASPVAAGPTLQPAH